MEVTPENLEAFARIILEAVQSSNWSLLASLALVALVWASRKFLAPKVPFLGTDAGGALLALAGGAAGAILTAVMAGSAFSWPLVLLGLKTGFTAAGGWAVIKKLIVQFWPKKPVEVVPVAPLPVVDVTAPVAYIGNSSPEFVKAFEEKMAAEGYIKQPDGTYKKQ